MHRVALGILFIALGFTGGAAQRPNFTGTWKIDVERSRIEAVPGLKNSALKIDQQESKVVISILDGHKNDTFEVPTDGAEQKITLENQPATASALWDDVRLVLTITRETPAGPVIETRSAKLSDTGKTMSTIYTVKDASGERRGYGFYVKQ